MLGLMCGDALGMAVEGRPPVEIMRKHGMIRDLLPGSLPAGAYTDDTVTAGALAESLVARRGFDPEDFAGRLAATYEARRGYGRGTREVIARLATGVPWDQAGKSVFGVGSFGNGAAMRVAPLGLLYHGDLEVAARLARLSAQVSHSHPLGQAGAAVQALAIALSLRAGIGGRPVADPAGLEPEGFLEEIEARLEAKEGLFRERLETVALLLDREQAPDLDSGPREVLAWAETVAGVLGNDSRAFQSVPTALYLFLSRRGNLEETLISAVALGGDTDTIAAMAGALAGAYSGLEALPQRWIEGLEEGARGRRYIAGLADDLFLLWLEEHADHANGDAALINGRRTEFGADPPATQRPSEWDRG
ncbi:MAG: ADP-ribosylglycohydrolase family protein [Thermoleophilia bacterium]